MRALVTGAAGFAGGHLVRALTSAGHEVWATSLEPPEDLPAPARGLVLDVTQVHAVEAVLADARPDVVFHLAGFAHVGKAERAADTCLAVNLGGTRAVLDAVLDTTPGSRVLVVSSAEVYGPVAADEVPVTEDAPVRPATVYALSKACAELAAGLAFQRGLDVVVARPFNHIGPGQSEDFVASAFARQIARIEAGTQEPVMRVGNLDAVRDFSHVRDTVAAYIALAERGHAGVAYNVTCGATLSIAQLLELLLAATERTIDVQRDPARMRASDVPIFAGSAARLREHTGWSGSFDGPATLREVLDYWRAREGVPARR